MLIGHKAFAIKVALIDLAISFHAVNEFALVLATTWSIIALLITIIFSQYYRIRFACTTFIITVDLVYWIFVSLDYTMFYASLHHKPPLLIDHLLHTVPAVFACLDLLFHPPKESQRNKSSFLRDTCIIPVSYLILLFFVKVVYDKWPYPFLYSWNIWIVVIASTLLVDLNVIIAQGLSNLISIFFDFYLKKKKKNHLIKE